MDYVKKTKLHRYTIKFTEKCPKYSDCNLGECIPKNVCPFLLHTSVPYYITYLHGGDFTWTGKSGHVEVRCPNPMGNVIIDVVNENKNLYASVKSTTDFCPIGYEKGLKIHLSKIFSKVCPLAYDVALPWVQLGVKDFVKLRCPGCDVHKGVNFFLDIKNED